MSGQPLALAKDVDAIEQDLSDVRERLSHLEAKVDGHERADQQRHEELRTGQARLEGSLNRLMLAQLAVVALGMVLMAGLVGVALEFKGEGLGALRVGEARAAESE